MKRILVVDDDEMFRAMLCETLRDAGYEVLDAENGRDAIKIVSGTKLDLVITDLIMPEKEGLETIREITIDYPGIKIIAVSGGLRGGGMDFLPIAGHMGAARVFRKPLDRKAFLAAVAELTA